MYCFHYSRGSVPHDKEKCQQDTGQNLLDTKRIKNTIPTFTKSIIKAGIIGHAFLDAPAAKR